MSTVMISCCTRYIEVNCSRSLASLANAMTSSFGILFFMRLPFLQIIRFLLCGLQACFGRCKTIVCLEGRMAGVNRSIQ